MRAIHFIFCLLFCLNAVAELTAEGGGGLVVRKESRRTLVSTENGEIVAARVDGGSYLLHFFTMDPNSLFLPAILHSDMIFYVSTGSGKLSWTEENEVRTADISRGDVYSLKSGAVFFIQSNLETETERQRLRITSIFANSNSHLQEIETEPYTSIRDMILGFDKKVLQAAFKVPDEVIHELFDGAKPPAIIHGVSKGERRGWDIQTTFLRSLLRSSTYSMFEPNKKKGKSSVKLFNLLKEDKDFENRNGWSTTVTKKKLPALEDTNIGLFMVNLSAGAMMGPHWNPTAAEIAIVVGGRGMIDVVCRGVWNGTERFEVGEGDIFVVPRFVPMAQMAFNKESFVFMGFSSCARKNHPQYMAGQASVLRTLSKDVLAKSFNVGSSTMDRLLASETDSVILSCVSCAEEELRILEEEKEKEREEAAAKEREREEEEAKRKEEERKRQEEEEERKREEEEAKKQEEERKRREEEEEAAAARRREEEAREREEEEERKRREEEQEAEATRRRKEEEEAKEREEEEEERQEEERKRREEQETETAREKEEEAREREEEMRRREKEEAAKAARREEQEAREREREEEEAERQEEEVRRRRKEERKRREEEEEEAREEEEQREQRRPRRKSEEEEAAEEERRREEEQGP